MDKFGIFNLLNSFFSFNKTENGQSNNNSTQSADLLGNLLSTFSNNKPTENKPEKTPLSSPLPLQSSMLSTINSHDAIVKRVKEKHK
ncbi:MAG: hypothetical protein J6V71_03025 [Clostridia bacterium]|nr:hypothetical protein [Clostridia bacterium]